MGYLATGYAFGAIPDWEGIHRLLSGFHIRGYKHRELELFLLDAWISPATGGEHFPFGAEPLRATQLKLPTPLSKPDAAIAFDEVCARLRESDSAYYGPDWLSVPLAVAAAARVSTFAFTADDDSFDFAAFIDSGAIARMGCRAGRFDLLLAGNGLRVVPRENDEDEDMQIEPALLAKLSSIRNVKVAEITQTSGGNQIYQYPTELWPVQWGDPAKLLGFGSFDPFEGFTDKFALVYESESKGPQEDIGPLGAVASCLCWPIGIFLACRYLLRSQRREAIQAALLAATGLAFMLLLDAATDKANGLWLVGYAIVAAGAALGLRSWLTRQSWLSGRRGRELDQ